MAIMRSMKKEPKELSLNISSLMDILTILRELHERRVAEVFEAPEREPEAHAPARRDVGRIGVERGGAGPSLEGLVVRERELGRPDHRQEGEREPAGPPA